MDEETAPEGTCNEKEAPKETLTEQLERLLATEQLDQSLEALHLLEDVENVTAIKDNSSDLINIVAQHFTDRNLALNFDFHNVCERILIKLALTGEEPGVVVELLEVVDSTHSDNTVVSVLKSLQALLLKRPEVSARYLEWVLGSLQLYSNELPLSQQLRNRLEDEEEQLLEEEDEVKRIVSFYIYMISFYEPILDAILQNEQANVTHFRDNGSTQRNVLLCYLIQMFGEPFAHLDFTDPSTDTRSDRNITLTNVYTRQNITALVRDIFKVRANPIELIAYGQQRALWPYVVNDDPEKSPEMPSDIFLLDSKVATSSLAIFFYALFVENLFDEHKPQIYRHVYLLEMGLYYCALLLKSTEETFRTKGIRLSRKLLDNLQDELLEDDTLDLDIHKTFGKNLLNVLDSTQIRRNSKQAVELLQLYISKFKTIDAKYFHIYHLLDNTSNNKIRSLLVTIYKNVIADQVNAVDNGELTEVSVFCRGQKLKWLLMNRICIMPKGVETDILQHNDLIMAALNMLRFLTLRDKKNYTKLWDFIGEIEEEFLEVLRKSLECTRAHFELEEKRIQENKTVVECEVPISGAKYMNMSVENQLQVLRNGRITLDLIQSVLVLLNESIDAHHAKNKLPK